jgi:hypothetical protein
MVYWAEWAGAKVDALLISVLNSHPLRKDSGISATQYFAPIVQGGSGSDDRKRVRGEARLAQMAIGRRESKKADPDRVRVAT